MPEDRTIEWTDASGTRRRVVFSFNPCAGWTRTTERYEAGGWRREGMEPVEHVTLG